MSYRCLYGEIATILFVPHRRLASLSSATSAPQQRPIAAATMTLTCLGAVLITVILLLLLLIIIIITTTMFMVLSSWPKSLREFTRFIWWMQTERRVAANPQTKTVDLGCESAENWQPSSTSTIAIVIITQPEGWYSFYRPTKGGRLSRPKHSSKGAQPVLKTVYRSSCRDKHNRLQCDSNLGPLTLR